jgi:acylglycerol lipase
MAAVSQTPPVLAEETGIAVSGDKTRLFYRAWAPEGASTAAPIALVVHGIGLHSGPYRVVADALVPHGIRVVAMDLRGHGRSGGTRGRAPSPAAVVMDLDAVTAKLRSAYGIDVVHLVGESMGTLVALHYAVARPEVVASLVLVGSAIRIARAQVLQAENLKLLPALLFQRDRPVVNLIGPRLDLASSDEAFKRERRQDPLALHKVSVNYLLALSRLRAGWRKKARAVNTPTLLIHGQRDAVVDWRGADALRRALASDAKQLIYFESARHTLFWDPATPRVFQMIRTWFDARSGHG